MEVFSNNIINWFQKNKRDLPWRNTKDPYFIWLSEIILQQTRVDQGMAYYHKFTQNFPTINDLANSDTEKVMKLWQGLGYYSRARNLHATANIISKNYKGKFPSDYNEILSLKGIGEYTAAAIASFAFDKPHAVVDGNVYRVLSRVFGIETPIDSTLGKKEFNSLANELLDKKNPALHNQSIMEFGAIQCKPVSPNCSSCVLNTMCFAYSKKLVSVLPVKAKKTKVRNRYFNYIVLHDKQNVLIKKRTEKDVWINLYDFPLVETDSELTEEQFLKSESWKTFSENFPKYSIQSISFNYKHILSHQKIYARFWNLTCSSLIKKTIVPNAILIQKADIEKHPVSRLIEKYLEDNSL